MFEILGHLPYAYKDGMDMDVLISISLDKAFFFNQKVLKMVFISP